MHLFEDILTAKKNKKPLTEIVMFHNQVVYHGTTLRNAESIMKVGFGNAHLGGGMRGSVYDKEEKDFGDLHSDDEELNQLSHRKKDFRSLFGSLTVRKEPDLENIPKYSYDELTDEQKKALHELPEIIIPKWIGLNDFEKDVPMEFVLHIQNPNTYLYVNTEGYKYARYSFVIEI